MSRLGNLRAGIVGALLASADLIYRHSGTWSDGTICDFGVSEPGRSTEGTRRAQALTGDTNVVDVRLLKVRPDQVPPGEGASIAWDGGRLTVIAWSQPSDFTGGAVAACRFTR